MSTRFALLINLLLIISCSSPSTKSTCHTDPQYIKSNSKDTLIMKYKRELLKFPSPFIDTFVETSLGSTHMLQWGNPENDTLILLHGLMGNSTQWGPELIKYLQNEYFLLSLETIDDNVGMNTIKEWPLTQDSLKIWLHEVLKKLNISKPTIAGLAFGGWIGIDYSINYPNNIKKLIVLGASGISIPNYIIFFKILFNVKKNSLDGFLKSYSYLRAKNAEINSSDINYFQTVFTHCKPMNHSPKKFTQKDIKKINSRTLFIQGKEDCYFSPVKTTKRLGKFGNNIEVIIINDAGHLLNLDQPLECYNNINKFIKLR